MENILETLTGPFSGTLKLVIGAVIILIVGWIIANIVKRLTLTILGKTQLDERLGNTMNTNMRLDRFIAKLFYYLVILFTLLIVLSHLGMDSALEPLQNMLNGFTGAFPGVIKGGILGYVGYIVAKLVSEASGFITTRVQDFAEKNGLAAGIDAGKLVKQLIFLLIFIPILIAALDALGIAAISEPATAMFETFLGAIPQILSAAVIIGVFYLVGHFLRPIVTELLGNLGIDKVVDSFDLDDSTKGSFRLSAFAGNLVFFFLLFTGIISGVEKLEMTRLSGMLDHILGLSGNVLLGGVILVIGNYISLFVKRSIASTEGNDWMGSLARYTVLFIFLGLGLSTMGIAQNVVNLIFGLTIGAVAVAFALSFGLGGREAAGKKMDQFLNKF